MLHAFFCYQQYLFIGCQCWSNCMKSKLSIKGLIVEKGEEEEEEEEKKKERKYQVLLASFLFFFLK